MEEETDWGQFIPVIGLFLAILAIDVVETAWYAWGYADPAPSIPAELTASR